MFNITFKYFFIPAIALGLTMLIMQFVFGVKLVPEGSLQEMQNFVKTGNMQGHQSAEIGGDFTLVNQHGETVSNTDFRGKLMLVYFGFATCPAVCPTDLANISAAMERLSEEQQAQVVPIFITVDPERDTSEALTKYMQSYYDGFQALTGTQEQVDVATKAYRVYAKKVEMAGMEGEYMMEHSAYTYLMGRDGIYITHFRHDESPEAIAEAVIGAL